MKKSLKLTFYIILFILAYTVIDSAWFILQEDELAIVQRFGKVEAIYVKNASPELLEQMHMNANAETIAVYEGSGLHLKIPLIDTVSKYSARLQTYNPPPREVIASDKKKVYFDNIAQWRIENPYLFYMAVRDISTASDRIDGILYSIMNEKVGKISSTDLITNKNSNDTMLRELVSEANVRTADFGVVIVDVLIRRTDLPQENYNSIYQRMRTERESQAAKYRSEGLEEAMIITSQTDKEVTRITSAAYKEAEILKGEGDSEAARIYSEAYGRNPEFFEFYNMLETYRQTIGQQSTLVIPNNSTFAKYLLGEG